MPGELCGAGWAGCHGGDSGCQWWELVTECRQPECPVLAPLVAPAGFRIAAQTEALAGTALVGQAVLYLWPDYGWVRGTVARRSRAAGFSHVVRYSRASALGSVEAPSLLDAASHGPAGRWVLLRHTTR